VPPLPNTKIIPANWQEFHRPTIQATFRSTVRLTRLGNPQGVRDSTTGRTGFAVPYIVYEGEARVQSRTTGAARGGTTSVADRVLTIGAYLIALPADSEIAAVGDVVEVLTCLDSPHLAGLSLVVVDVPAADIAWQRSYGADLYQPTIRG
jgi:hypothetical protein